ncbi:Arabinanase/levansucrase/invertase [Dacryopinax primogenitus]|uniref:Arabinanase/levansucrase/invertase n=1 Tax=Dacryopinax primogenitus (strain DJM 731) TaxID=1858805 RepID=M5FZE7_DACPD|nr:Arabinanase/levansucrase/invertase [Dacryopinax primogenitus]EJU01240.1 Arabinanase/levansucrase/invertase [Dacryopinax primogenitus]
MALDALRNPIIPGLNPNPSCVCVSGTYYLVSASLLYFPSIPVYTSVDLVEWKNVGYVCTRPSQLDTKDCNLKPGTPWPGGICAATIRYHGGVFYVTATLVYGDKQPTDSSRWQNFLFTCTDPTKHEWSDPLQIDFMGYDTSLFFDDNGKAYLQGLSCSRAKPEIQQMEIDFATGNSPRGSPKTLWKPESGTYIEGPHMYRNDGFYYLLFSEGEDSNTLGTALMRSSTPWGPFDSSVSPLLPSPPNVLRPTGHTELVHSPTGWLALFASPRQGTEVSSLGPEAHLLPLTWPSGEWPTLGPALPVNTPTQTTTDVLALPPLASTSLPLSVLTIRAPPPASPYRRIGPSLILRSDEIPLPTAESPSLILLPQRRQRSTWHFILAWPGNGPSYDVGPIFEGGVTVYLDWKRHVDFAIIRNLVWTGQARVRIVGPQCTVSGRLDIDLPARLRVETFKDGYEFWAMHKGEWKKIDVVDVGLVSGDRYGGVAIGPFLTSHEAIEMYVQEWKVETHEELEGKTSD